MEDSVQFIQSLLQKQPDLNSITRKETALEMAVYSNMRNEFNVLRRVCARRTHVSEGNPRAVDAQEWQFAQNVVKTALRHGDDEVQLLIASQNVIDTAQNRGLTPLHFTLLMKKTQITQVLLRAGADTTIRDDTWLSLMQYAVHSREHTIFDLLFKEQGNADGNEALLMAIDLDNVEAVRILLLRYHCHLPLDLRNRMCMSPETRAFLGTFWV